MESCEGADVNIELMHITTNASIKISHHRSAIQIVSIGAFLMHFWTAHSIYLRRMLTAAVGAEICFCIHTVHILTAQENFNWIWIHEELHILRRTAGARKDWVRGSADPPPSLPQIWSWGQKLHDYHFALFYRHAKFYRLHHSTNMALMKINVSCYMIKLNFWPWLSIIGLPGGKDVRNKQLKMKWRLKMTVEPHNAPHPREKATATHLWAGVMRAQLHFRGALSANRRNYAAGRSWSWTCSNIAAPRCRSKDSGRGQCHAPATDGRRVAQLRLDDRLHTHNANTRFSIEVTAQTPPTPPILVKRYYATRSSLDRRRLRHPY